MSWLSEQRRKRNWTQAEAAERFGCSPVWLSLIETGVGRPSPELVSRIATELGIPRSDAYAELLPELYDQVTERASLPGSMNGRHVQKVPIVGTIERQQCVVWSEDVERESILLDTQDNPEQRMLYALRVLDDCLAVQAILSGDLVVVERKPLAQVQDGNIVIITTKDRGVIVRRVFREEGSTRLLFHCGHTQHAPLAYQRREVFLEGVVVQVIRPHVT